jgi:hypothetical protein
MNTHHVNRVFMLNTVEDIFSEFDGKTSAFAKALGLKLSAASEMRRRRSIPVKYWPRLVEIARERSIAEITYDTLVSIHAERAA